MFVKVSILVVSLLFAVVVASDANVSHAVERYLDSILGIQLVEANSKPLYIQRALDGFKAAGNLLDKYSADEYQTARSDPKSDRSKQILKEVGVNGLLFVANHQEEMKSAIKLFVAANESNNCKHAVQSLETLFGSESGKIKELIGVLRVKCSN